MKNSFWTFLVVVTLLVGGGVAWGNTILKAINFEESEGYTTEMSLATCQSTLWSLPYGWLNQTGSIGKVTKWFQAVSSGNQGAINQVKINGGICRTTTSIVNSGEGMTSPFSVQVDMAWSDQNYQENESGINQIPFVGLEIMDHGTGWNGIRLGMGAVNGVMQFIYRDNADIKEVPLAPASPDAGPLFAKMYRFVVDVFPDQDPQKTTYNLSIYTMSGTLVASVKGAAVRSDGSPTTEPLSMLNFSIDGGGSDNHMDELFYDNIIVSSISSVSAPTITPDGRYVSSNTLITMSTPTEGANIYYTIDGTLPTTGSLLYTVPITLNAGVTMLNAVAVVEGRYVSAVTSHIFEVPSSYDGPAVISMGSAMIDGDLSDWSQATWTSLNTIYHGMPSDIIEAEYAAKWQAEKIYVAIRVHDISHFFTDEYIDWNARDAIELYLHTTGGEPLNYANCTTAQQYSVGFKKTDNTKVWITLSNESMYKDNIFSIPENSGYDNVIKAAGHINGEWLNYEIEITPFSYLGIVTGRDNVLSPLQENDVIGLDVCVVGNSEGNYTGMKSENAKTGKNNDYRQFGLHKLITENSFLAYQWGPITPNGTNGSAYYLNDNMVGENALCGTIGGGPWELDKAGAVIHWLSNANTAKSAVKVGDYIYYTYSGGSSYVYRSSTSTWDVGTAVSISDNMPLSSLVTDGTCIYASTTKKDSGYNQISKYSVDPASGDLTLIWTTTGIDETGVRGLSYYDGATNCIYAVSGGRNTSSVTGNTAHIYAIRTDTGAVTDMGAITHMGEAYQIARNYNQLWIADALSTGDGQVYIYDLANDTTLASSTPRIVCNPYGIKQIYGMAIDDGFVWMTTASGQVYGYRFQDSLISGDANGDGAVDVGDLGILAANYGGSAKTWTLGDFNKDGLVDVGDLGILAAHYGEGVNGTANFSADYAKVFGTTLAEEDSTDEVSSSTCSELGLPLIAGLALIGLMLVKLEE